MWIHPYTGFRREYYHVTRSYALFGHTLKHRFRFVVYYHTIEIERNSQFHIGGVVQYLSRKNSPRRITSVDCPCYIIGICREKQ